MPKDTLVDARGHMLGRLASVLAKQLLNGEQIVSVPAMGVGSVLVMPRDTALPWYLPLICFHLHRSSSEQRRSAYQVA